MPISSGKPRFNTQEYGLRSKPLSWSRILTLFFGLGGGACQACSLLACMLVIHNMDKQHHVSFAFTVNLLGTLGVFTLL
jgi:hypothetical protein